MMDGTIVLALSLKALGSVSGGVLALVFQPPKILSQFVTRGVFSIFCGLLFSDAVRDHFGWADSWQMNVSASALTSMLSWFLMAAAVRLIARWTPPKGE